MRKPKQSSTGKNIKSNTNAIINRNGEKLRKGLWSPEEDEKLVSYMTGNGLGCWSEVARNAGLQRCGKSCRLRWINYLRPDLKRGAFSPQEKDLIFHLHSLLGNRWSQIAAYLPGRTDNEIKNFWNSVIKKRQKKSLSSPTMANPSLENPMDDNKDLGDGHIMGMIIHSSSNWIDLSSSSPMSYSVMHRPMDPLYNPYPNPSHTLRHFPGNGLYFNVQGDDAQGKVIDTYNDINQGTFGGDIESHIFHVPPFSDNTNMTEKIFEIEKSREITSGDNNNIIHSIGEIGKYQYENNINKIKVENKDVGYCGGYIQGEEVRADEWNLEALMIDSSFFSYS